LRALRFKLLTAKDAKDSREGREEKKTASFHDIELSGRKSESAECREDVTAGDVHIRKATAVDILRLREVIESSVRGLQAKDYTPAQIEGALATVYGVDSQLIADGTYFVAEIAGPGANEFTIVACGGWSKRKTLYGGDQFSGREDSLLNPACDAAKVRAFFVHPKWARRGIGGMILRACEEAAQDAGFSRLEMGATLSGVPFYRAKGYEEVERQQAPLGDGEWLAIVKMAKEIKPLNR
jgi:GNAT superfamily N-acetyltransferase